MKIYTKTGDDGTTSLFGGARVRKHHLRIEAYGTVDELNSSIGLARSVDVSSVLDPLLERIQHDLFVLGSDLATPLTKRNVSVPRILESQVLWLERQIDEFDSKLPPLTVFVLPAGSAFAAHLHVCRTICRRAERLTVQVSDTEEINVLDMHYLNRLSDLLFVLARFANASAGLADLPWNSV